VGCAGFILAATGSGWGIDAFRRRAHRLGFTHDWHRAQMQRRPGYRSTSLDFDFLGSRPVMRMAAYWVRQTADHRTLQFVGGALSLAWLSVVPLGPPRTSCITSAEFFGGRRALPQILFDARGDRPCRRHYIKRGTKLDTDTAPRGSPLVCLLRGVPRSPAPRIAQDRDDHSERQGYGRWSIRHRLWKAIFWRSSWTDGLLADRGWRAVGVALAP